VESPRAIQAEAAQLLQLANQARAGRGIAPLRWDASLATAARQHCLRMVAENSISHRYSNEPDVANRAAQAGAHFNLVEENVAVAPTPAAIHNGWMRSSGHRSNLLNPGVDHVGIAVVAGRHGLYAVADYEHAIPLLSQTQVEASVSSLLRAQGISVAANPTNARAYCASGNQDRVRSSHAMLWQQSDPTQLPTSLKSLIGSGKYHQAIVGSCPPQSLEGPFTTYRVAVLLE